MPDHLHLLCSPDQSGLTIGSIIGRYKGLTTSESWRCGLSGRLWQARYFDHIVRKTENVCNVARYIYENPDRKGLSPEYPYRWVHPNL
jgi:REP element-mobilizing transposase RayT